MYSTPHSTTPETRLQSSTSRGTSPSSMVMDANGRKLSTQSSRVLADEDANSLTSFPDPGPSSPPVGTTDTGHVERPESSARNSKPLNHLLDQSGPSMFDEQATVLTEPQTLSAASTDHLRTIIDHHGPVELTRRLAALLAERDAHITALVRLAQEYKIPPARIEDASSRAKQAERRRLSLANASEDLVSSAADPSIATSDSSGSAIPIKPVEIRGTTRGLTRLFGGGTSRLKSNTPDSSRSGSQGPPPATRKNRPQSIDTRSIQSQDSGTLTNWATNLFAAPSTRQRQNSQPKRPKQPLELVTQHDKDQLPPTLSSPTKDPHEAQWNRFIVKLNETRASNGEHHEGGETIGLSRFGQEGSVGQQKLKALTQLVLGGIPLSLRHPIWMELSNTHAMMTPGGYRYYLNLREHGDQTEIEEILKDVPRTLTRQYDFYTGKGYERLKKVLVAFIGRYEGLGYTQGLNTIAGYLLLTIPSEEDAFWVLCNIIENFFPPDYFSKAADMHGPLADNIVLRQCVREQLPQLAKHLDELGISPDHTVPLSWFFTAFSTALPQEILMRIWDVWLCLPAQKTFIFNIALTILSQNASELIECENEGEYWTHLEQCTTDMSKDPDKVNELIKHAFLMRKKLDHVEDRRNVEFKVLRRKRDSMEVLYESRTASST